jgi:hypothetical protein
VATTQCCCTTGACMCYVGEAGRLQAHVAPAHGTTSSRRALVV